MTSDEHKRPKTCIDLTLGEFQCALALSINKVILGYISQHICGILEAMA